MIQQEGPGWRLAHDPSRLRYPVLIGGEAWAFELTEWEWQGLVALVSELTNQHQALVDQLLEEEAITLEMERAPWWGCLEGHRDRWALHVLLEADATGGRGVEGHWPAPAAQAVTAAMRTIWDSGSR